MNFQTPDTIGSEGSRWAYIGDLLIDLSGRVTVVWDSWDNTIGYAEIRYNVKPAAGSWGTAANLTTGYSGYGRGAPTFIRGYRYDVFPSRRQIIYCENYNDGTDKRRIVLYTFPD